MSKRKLVGVIKFSFVHRKKFQKNNIKMKDYKTSKASLNSQHAIISNNQVDYITITCGCLIFKNQ